MVSQASSDPARNAIQLALALERDFWRTAVRANLSGHDAVEQGTRLINVLNALGEPDRAWVLLECGGINQANDLANSAALASTLQAVRNLKLAGIAIITTSFPDSKPANGTTRTIASLDLAAQTRIHIGAFATPLTYGDYAATNPSGAIEYVQGMQVIPFASYFSEGEWWQTRQGGDKEFSAYVDIAKAICALPGFHGQEFCWGTSEISRIAAGVGGNGNNGTWNGIRINQHICAMLDYLDKVSFPAVPAPPAGGIDDEGDDAAL